jgi:cold shock CspA family protein
VDIQLHVPGEEILVSRRPQPDGRIRDAYAMVHDAFDAARRQVEDYARRRRRETKHHDTGWNVGHIADVFASDGFGFIEGLDGHRIYFHQNSVERNQFAELKRGTPVYFVEEPGQKGPQAAVVRLIWNQSRKTPKPAMPQRRLEASW